MPARTQDDGLVHMLMALNRQMVSQLSGDGLPVDQWRVLSLLRGNPDGLTMGGICEGMGMPAPSVTKLIDRMVAEALVYRIPNPRDRRVVVILASDKGKALLEETNGRMGRYEDQLSAEFEAKDVAKLQEMLSHLLASKSS
ncbi:MarR family transcriptional regulator [Paracoccus sp. MBLB3053]|uniref:MarR family transcriptional regulator n=1 Tax=Paracoccus aurantius TaxID=3073814 RepID=A0ABU2HRL7_9RHOB|nr:MarR family transcriptional regulator [Paracoccus sp. MBLB3053]MDS9467696.1 MarR family transcriptional regulator [Paracoccus sp. MBLB3053]